MESFLGVRGWGLKSNTGLHLSLRLRIGGALPAFSPYAAIAWTGVALPLTLYQPKYARGSFVGEELYLKDGMRTAEPQSCLIPDVPGYA
jgi:hypothetical protein